MSRHRDVPPGQHTHPLPRLSVRWIRIATGVFLVVLAVVAVPAVALPFIHGPGLTVPPPPTVIEQSDLNVAVVPAADSAGFFVALHEGLFTAHGLRVTFIPAVSSETVINAQALGETGHQVDISCGNYVSFIQAQEAYDRGQRPTSINGGVVAADLDIFAEGSIMQPATQGLYTMPHSRVTTLADLRGRVIGVNAPGNILYLLAASVLTEHGIAPSSVRFTYIPLPAMAAALKAGKVAAAVLPEPFASQAELSMGVVPLADLDQGATDSFPVQGCAVTRQWAEVHPVTLAAFRAAFEEGQRIADQDRSAVEQAMEALPAPLGLTPVQAAVMAVDSYPVGPVDAVRIQRVADVMREFLGFPKFRVQSMLGG
jgi:NitT/TauT family transport system substrate-binding protein